MIRAQVPPEQLDDAGVVRAYKSLAAVERAFRHLKTVDLELRPFYVRDPAPRAGARGGVPAGLPPGMAPAAEAGAAAVRGAGPRRGRAAANGTELGKTKSGFSEDPPIR